MKKFSTKLRQFLSAALAALLAVSLLPLSATAAGEEYLYRVVGVGNKFTISGNYGGRFTQGKVGQFDDILMGPSRSNLREVYCLQFMVPSGQNEGSDMSRNEIDAGNYDELTQEQIQRINYAVAFGYNDYTKDNPSWAYAYDRDSARWATQALIWSIAEGVFNGPNEAALVADFQKSGFANLTSIYYSIKEKILNFRTIPSYSASSQYTAPTHNLYYNPSTGLYEATLHDDNGVSNAWNFIMDGVTFTHVNANTLKVTTSRTDVENGTVSAQKTIETSGETGVTSGKLKVFTNKDDYQAVCRFDQGTPDPVHAYFKLKIATGNIEIVKSAEDGNVSGKQFRITGNGIDRTVTTQANGSVLATGLNPGTYTVTEVNTPTQYVQPNSAQITVQAGQTATASFNNKLKKFTVSGQKKDLEAGTAQGDASLDGAVYGLYHDGALVERMTTANGGQFSSGTYTCDDGWTIREISPAPGYNLDSTVYPVGAQPGKFTVEYNTIQATVNEQVIKGQVQIHKFLDTGAPGMGDDQIKQPEAGAEFQVYLTQAGSYDAAKETERDYLTTNADGYARTKLLPYGDYTFHQVKGAAGTELVSDFRVVISEQGQTLSYYIENPQVKSPIKIVKQDAETGKTVPLSGMGVKIMDMATHQYIVQHVPYPSDEYIDTFYTNTEGWLMMPEPLPLGYYQAVEVQAPYGYVLNSDPVDFYVNGIDSTTVEVVISDTAQKGQITVGKTGEIFSTVQVTTSDDGTSLYQPVYTNGTLSGAVYEIYSDEDIITPDGTLRYAKDTLVDTLTTGTKDTSDKLYLGRYRIVETKAPNGYVLNTEPQYVTLSYAGQNIEIVQAGTSFHNERQKLQLDLVKALEQDETFQLGMNEEYRNIRFGLYANEAITAADGTSIPKDGLIEIVGLDADLQAAFASDLPQGSYYVQEIATDDHYILNGTKYLVTFTYQDQMVQTVHITANDGQAIPNEIKRGNITGYKVDQDGFALGGALIGLFRADETAFTEDNALSTCVSNEIGAFGFFDVPYGEYLVAEIAPPEGFLLTDRVIPVSIKEEGQTVEIESIANQIITGSVQVIKIDQDYPDNRLTGAEFTVYRDVDGNQEFDPQIDIAAGTMQEADGVYTLGGLVYGGYFLRESKAPEYFIQDDNVYYFSIINDGETVTVETEPGVGFANAAQTGKLHIVKTAEDGNVAGIEFRVTGTDYTGHAYDQMFATDENGEILIEGLRPGEYTVAEINGDGEKYVLPADQTVEIKADEMAELTFHNALVPETGDTGLSTAVFIAAAAACGILLLHRRRKES